VSAKRPLLLKCSAAVTAKPASAVMLVVPAAAKLLSAEHPAVPVSVELI